MYWVQNHFKCLKNISKSIVKKNKMIKNNKIVFKKIKKNKI